MLELAQSQTVVGATPTRMAASVASLLDRQFRLLREDFMAPLRSELQLLKRAEEGVGKPPRFTFRGVWMIRVEPKPRPCILVSVGLPPGHGALRCRSKKEKKDFWEQHRGIFAQEALCVLAVKGLH